MVSFVIGVVTVGYRFGAAGEVTIRCHKFHQIGTQFANITHEK